MNRKSLLFLPLLLLFFMNNSYASETIIMLQEFSVKDKELSRDVVIIQDNTVIVNKEKLSATEIITQSENISQIAHFPKVAESVECTSGIYRHILKKGKKLKTEKGCLEGERYKILKENFKALKKDHITQ